MILIIEIKIIYIYKLYNEIIILYINLVKFLLIEKSILNNI